MIDEDDKTDLVKSVNEVGDNTTKMIEKQEMHVKVSEFLVSFIKEHNDFFETVAEIIRLCKKFFDEVVSPIINFLGLVSRDWLTNRELMSKSWFIADKKIISYLALHPDVNRDEYIRNYYLADECNELAFMVEQWAKCESIQHRYPILKDCFESVKMAQGQQNINIANVVIPTLMAQTEGLLKEIRELFLKNLGGRFLKLLDIDLLPINKKKGKNLASNKKAPILILFEFLLYEVHLAPSREIMGGLFKNSYDYEEERKKGINVTTLNRHKILHGDSLDYGTKENLVRLFVSIDSIVKIITRLNNAEKAITKE